MSSVAGKTVTCDVFSRTGNLAVNTAGVVFEGLRAYIRDPVIRLGTIYHPVPGFALDSTRLFSPAAYVVHRELFQVPEMFRVT